MKQATCTTMLMTDGTNSVYAVMKGPMGRKYFNVRKAVIVAKYNVVGKPDYRAMTAVHATPDAPAVYWQA
jgi:hypothetical protein